MSGLIQGIKVFKEGTGIDASFFKTKKPLTRSTRKYGEIAGYQIGSVIVTDYEHAVKQIFVPAYEWVLEHNLAMEMELLANYIQSGWRIALLDNTDGVSFTHATVVRDHLMSRSDTVTVSGTCVLVCRKFFQQ